MKISSLTMQYLYLCAFVFYDDLRNYLKLGHRRRKRCASLWNLNRCESVCYIHNSGKHFCGFRKVGYGQLGRKKGVCNT